MRKTRLALSVPLVAFAAACSDLPMAPAGQMQSPASSPSLDSTPGGGDIILYGAQNGAGQGDLYKVNLTTGTTTLVYDFPSDPSDDSNSPNGLAIDQGAGRLYYSVTGPNSATSSIYFIDVNSPGTPTLVGTAPGLVYNADIAGGAYYYVQNETDDLFKVNLNPDGTAASAPQAVCSDLQPGASLAFGDIAIKDGVLYGSATNGFSPPVYFFTVNLSNCSSTFLPVSYTQKLQLAWGADGQLYGHFTNSGEFWTVDSATGDLTPVAAPTDFGGHYSDLAPGITPPPPPTVGTEGCTPGYWKQSQHFGNWNGYTPDEQFSAVFENAFPGMTLQQVLSQGGGGLNALGRHTVAALLDAASGIDYGLTTTQVIQQFNAVFPGGDYEALQNELASRNERGCPLGRSN